MKTKLILSFIIGMLLGALTIWLIANQIIKQRESIARKEVILMIVGGLCDNPEKIKKITFETFSGDVRIISIKKLPNSN